MEIVNILSYLRGQNLRLKMKIGKLNRNENKLLKNMHNHLRNSD